MKFRKREGKNDLEELIAALSDYNWLLRYKESCLKRPWTLSLLTLVLNRLILSEGFLGRKWLENLYSLWLAILKNREWEAAAYWSTMIPLIKISSHFNIEVVHHLARGTGSET